MTTPWKDCPTCVWKSDNPDMGTGRQRTTGWVKIYPGRLSGVMFHPGNPPINPPAGIVPCPTCAAFHAAVDAASAKAWDAGYAPQPTTLHGKRNPNPYRRTP